MAHNIHLAEKVRPLLKPYAGISEREKRSGLTFMLGDKICAWIKGHTLIVRCIPAETEAALMQPGVTRFTMKGREQMKGWLIINPDETDLNEWMKESIAFVLSLKQGKKFPQ